MSHLFQPGSHEYLDQVFDVEWNPESGKCRSSPDELAAAACDGT